MGVTRTVFYLALALAVLCAVDAQGGRRGRGRGNRGRGRGRGRNENQNEAPAPPAGDRDSSSSSDDSDSSSSSSSGERGRGQLPLHVCHFRNLDSLAEEQLNCDVQGEEPEMNPMGEEELRGLYECDMDNRVILSSADGDYEVAFCKRTSVFYEMALARIGSRPCAPDMDPGCHGPFRIGDMEQDQESFFCSPPEMPMFSSAALRHHCEDSSIEMPDMDGGEEPGMGEEENEEEEP